MKKRAMLLWLIGMAGAITPAMAQSCASGLTPVQDTIAAPAGPAGVQRKFAGTVTVTPSNPIATAATFGKVPYIVTVLGNTGAFFVCLAPNDTATPSGTAYSVKYAHHDAQGSATWTETWYVRTSSSPVSIASVRTTLPAAPGAVIPGAVASTIAVGTTTTGAAGSSANVTNSGTSSAAVLNFTVPQGATGANGSNGATGATGATGAPGPAGPAPSGTGYVYATGGTSSVKTLARAIGYTFDGGGSALTSGVTRYLTVPFACTLSAWNIAVDTGTATVKTWKIATGTAVPTVSNTLSTAGVSIASGTAIHSATMTDFSSTAVSANDIFGFNLYAVASATQINFILECDQ